MKVLGVIPARFASTRFPGKPLADIGGKSMIRRVYEQARQCPSLQQVVVATDDRRIADHVTGFGGQAVLTGSGHQSGTDRCAEVARLLPEYDVYINIQGDEPFIDPGQITAVAACFGSAGTVLATLIKKVSSPEELMNPNTPKVVINSRSEAIYFSRTPIPYFRGLEPASWLSGHTYYKHIGIYGYRKDTLQQITGLPVSPLERTEALEQLRWIENGFSIRVAETAAETQAVDTPEDLERIRARFSHLF
ncbi:MAG TPA: 3-deoxy-manno-octulosonate cytidylyltransferase [Sphingobacteriaceae bacterium]